jgi:hypothetical protein
LFVKCAGAADIGCSEGARAVEHQRAVVGDGSCAQCTAGAAVAHQQRAGADGGGAVVGVVAEQFKRSGACLGQVAGAANRSCDAQVCVGLQGAASIEGHSPRGSEGRGVLQRAAVKAQAVGGFTQVVVSGDGEHTIIDVCAAPIRVDAGESQGAGAGLGQARAKRAGSQVTGNDVARCEICIGLKGAAVFADVDGALHGKGAGGAQRAAVEVQQVQAEAHGVQRAQVFVCGDRQRACEDEGALGIGVVAGQDQGAGASLGEAGSPADLAVMGQRAAVCRNRAGEDRRVAIHRDIASGLQRGTLPYEESARGGAQVVVAGYGKRAALDDRATLVAVGAGEGQGTGAVLAYYALGAGDDAREIHGIDAIEGQRAVVDHITRDGAAADAVAYLQGSLADGGAAAVGVGARQDQGAGAGLGQAPRPADHTLLGQRFVRDGRDGAARRPQRGGAIHGDVFSGLQRTAIEGQPAD